MYDIRFFQAAQKIKDKIIRGDFNASSSLKLDQDLEALRSPDPFVFNIETTNYCNMTCQMCPRTRLMTRDNIWIDDETFKKSISVVF
jgi:hypothetical protein